MNDSMNDSMTQSFDDIAERVVGGYEFSCEGSGHGGGCLGFTRRTRPWRTVGNKHGGWLVCYALNDDGTEDTEVVLVLCPVCRWPVTERPVTERVSES